jgi:hypothetical protein
LCIFFHIPGMTRWAYKTIKLATTGFSGGKLDTDVFENLLNGLGHEGWELVSTFDTNHANGATRDVVAVFKRPVVA